MDFFSEKDFFPNGNIYESRATCLDKGTAQFLCQLLFFLPATDEEEEQEFSALFQIASEKQCFAGFFFLQEVCLPIWRNSI